MKTFYKKELKTVMAIFALAFGLLLTNTAQAQNTTIVLGVVNACDSWTAPWDGLAITTSGATSGTNAAGDTTWTVDLIINDSHTASDTRNECDSYTYGDSTWTTSGTYTYNDPTVAGCDSVITFNLTINSGVYNDPVGYNVSACDSYTDSSGTVHTTNGAFLDTTTGHNGCPVVRTWNLTISGNAEAVNVSRTACDAFTVSAKNGTNGDSTWTTSGTYTYIDANEDGCDSVITINLLVNTGHEYNPTTATVEACDSYTMPGSGTVYTIGANPLGVTDIDTVISVGTAANGCDVITYNTFVLTWNGAANSGADSVVTSCGSFTWGDSTWTTSGTYTYPTGTNVDNCDSTRDVVLTIVDYANGGASIADSSAVNGHNITVGGIGGWINWNSCGPVTVASGTVVDSTALANSGFIPNQYIDTVTDAAGCMTLYDYEINIAASGTSNPDVLLSESGHCDSWTDENGTEYTADGLYSYTRTNTVNGCDETVILTISGMISSTPDVNFSMNACNNYTWNGITYDSTDTYTQSYTNSAGCSSDSVLNLTIGSTSTSDFAFMDECETYTYYDANYAAQTTTTAGVYTSHFVAANGCDSAIVVTLTVLPAASGEVTYYGCDSLVWNGTTYLVSTTVDDTLTSSNGCDSIVTVSIDIAGASAPSALSASACNSYTAGDGNVYTTSQVFTDNATNQNGCDSIVLVTLTITNSQNTMDVVECGTEYYTPSGDTLTTDGTYMDTIAGLMGCDSILTINLSFGTSANGVDDVHSCNGIYNWAG
jgi:hypothetical protein